jgi:hypothetical protein
MRAAWAGSPPGGGGGSVEPTAAISGLDETGTELAVAEAAPTGSLGRVVPSWTEAVDMMFWRLWTNQGFFSAKEFN